VSKTSAAERGYLRHLHQGMASGDIRSIVSDELVSELHHPLRSFWETGKGLKARYWFAVSLTLREHRLFHSMGRESRERQFGTLETLLKASWSSIGFEPVDFMFVGMDTRRSA
jgi:hypothetical protein